MPATINDLNCPHKLADWIQSLSDGSRRDDNRRQHCLQLSQFMFEQQMSGVHLQSASDFAEQHFMQMLRAFQPHYDYRDFEWIWKRIRSLQIEAENEIVTAAEEDRINRTAMSTNNQSTRPSIQSAPRRRSLNPLHEGHSRTYYRDEYKTKSQKRKSSSRTALEGLEERVILNVVAAKREESVSREIISLSLYSSDEDEVEDPLVVAADDFAGQRRKLNKCGAYRDYELEEFVRFCRCKDINVYADVEDITSSAVVKHMKIRFTWNETMATRFLEDLRNAIGYKAVSPVSKKDNYHHVAQCSIEAVLDDDVFDDVLEQVAQYY